MVLSWHIEVQKHMLQLSPSLTFLDSNTQALVPSSSTLFHHRSPTSNLPVTFFTVQKSNAKSRTMVRNSSIKWPETKNGMRRYTSSAEVRKKTWKNAARGCLEMDGSTIYFTTAFVHLISRCTLHAKEHNCFPVVQSSIWGIQGRVEQRLHLKKETILFRAPFSHAWLLMYRTDTDYTTFSVLLL